MQEWFIEKLKTEVGRGSVVQDCFAARDQVESGEMEGDAKQACVDEQWARIKGYIDQAAAGSVGKL